MPRYVEIKSVITYFLSQLCFEFNNRMTQHLPEYHKWLYWLGGSNELETYYNKGEICLNFTLIKNLIKMETKFDFHL